MIVDNLHVVRLAITPREANPPPIVDPNTALPQPICLESFKTVPRRDSKIFEPLDRVKVEQLAACHALDRPESRSSSIVEERLGVPASERSDHNSAYDVGGIPSSAIDGKVGSSRIGSAT